MTNAIQSPTEQKIISFPCTIQATVIYYEFTQKVKMMNTDNGPAPYYTHKYKLATEEGVINGTEFSRTTDHFLGANDQVEIFVNNFYTAYNEYAIKLKRIIMKQAVVPQDKKPVAELEEPKLPQRAALDDSPMNYDEHDLQLLHAATVFNLKKPGATYVEVLTTFTYLSKCFKDFRTSTAVPYQIIEFRNNYEKRNHAAPPSYGSYMVGVGGHTARSPLDETPMTRDLFEMRLLQEAALLHSEQPASTDRDLMATFGEYTLFFESIRKGHPSIYEEK